MVLGEKLINFRIKPYSQEAQITIWIDSAVTLLLFVVLLVARFPWWAVLAPILAYIAFALIFHYRVIIQAMIDRRNNECVTEIVTISKFKEEYSGASNGHGSYYVRFFYPSEMRIDKYRIHVVNSNGEKRKLRSIMSAPRFHKLLFLKLLGVKKLQVVYLKRSKILLRVDPFGEIDVKKKELRQIEKNLQKINNTI